MKHVATMRDLEPFGIIPLTGEADALSFRMLCDLTPRGVKIFCETFGIMPAGLKENWNSSKGAVASVMLPQEAVLPLGVIALVDAGYEVIATDKDVIYGLEHDEAYDPGEIDWKAEGVVWLRKPQIKRGEDWMPWPAECYGTVKRRFNYGRGERRGTMNVHAMSGRAA